MKLFVIIALMWAANICQWLFVFQGNDLGFVIATMVWAFMTGLVIGIMFIEIE